MRNKLLIMFITLSIWSCEMDKKTGIVVIANDKNSPLLIVKQPDQIITDSLVFFDQVDGTEFIKGEVRTISLPYNGFKSLPDSEKLYLFILNLDSVEKFRNDKSIDGILSKSLIKKVSIQLNEVKDKLDTVYVSR